MVRKIAAASALSLALLAFATSASAVTIGNEAVSRSATDTYNFFGLALSIDIATSGTLTDWNVHVGNVSGNEADDRLALVVLDTVAGGFQVAQIDERSTPDVGAYSFSTALDVLAGQTLGLIMGTAKVSFDFGSGLSVFATTNRFFSPDFAEIGSTISDWNVGRREYSLNATIVPSTPPVPLPTAMWMLLAGLGALVAVRKARA